MDPGEPETHHRTRTTQYLLFSTPLTYPSSCQTGVLLGSQRLWLEDGTTLESRFDDFSIALVGWGYGGVFTQRQYEAAPSNLDILLSDLILTMTSIGARHPTKLVNQQHPAPGPTKLRRHTGHRQAPPPKSSSKPVTRQNSRKLVPRNDQRNESPWLIPTTRTALATQKEESSRDSLSDDIFFRAYYDPSLQQSVHDSNDDERTKKRAHAKPSEDGDPVTSELAEPNVRDGKVNPRHHVLYLHSSLIKS